MLITMKKKKILGFTLIEVLSVITILAVLAVIILPIVSNMIESSRKNSFMNSIYNAMNAIKSDLSNNDFKDYPSSGVLAKSEIPTLEKNPFIDGKFRLKAKEVEAFKVTNGRYCATGIKTDLEVVLGPCYLLDHTEPVANLVAGAITSNSIQIIMNAYDEESDIVSYEYSIDNGSTWTSKQTSNTYTFTKLKNGTSFNFKARVTNENKLTTEKSITLKTLDIGIPTYTSNPSLTAWSKNKVVTIHYPVRQSNFIYEYSLNGGSSWSVVPSGTTHNVTFTSNGNLTARVRDGYNTVTASTLTITTVDTLSPSVTLASTGVTNFAISVKATGVGSHMGIKGYQYSSNNGASWSGVTTSNTYTFSELSRNTSYPLKVRIIAGNDKTADSATLNVRTLNQFNVYFNANGGSVSTSSKIVTGGSAYGTLPSPTRANYNFLGWYTATSGGSKISSDSVVNLSGDQTLYAQWKLNTVIVTFDANEGNSTTSRPIVIGGKIGSFPGVSRNGYTHKGWYTAKGGGTAVNGDTVVNSPTTYYSRWYHNGVSGSAGNGWGYTLTVSAKQSGINSIDVTAYMNNGGKSACGNGSIKIQCGSFAISKAVEYNFGVSGGCSFSYDGSMKENMSSVTFTQIPTRTKNINCTYSFYSNNYAFFGPDLSVSTGSFTMGD